jgi:hypothetical protein
MSVSTASETGQAFENKSVVVGTETRALQNWEADLQSLVNECYRNFVLPVFDSILLFISVCAQPVVEMTANCQLIELPRDSRSTLVL